nr:hypothetical protein GCM10020093_117050 [Planobispora longispora]
MTNLAELVITLKVNSESAAEAISGTRKFVDNMVMSWDREHHVLKFRLVLNAMTRAWLTPSSTRSAWARCPVSRVS